MRRRAAALLAALSSASAAALQCPEMPRQASRDTEVEVRVGVRLLGDAKGPDLEARTRQMTTDLLGRVPRADQVYLEQMLFAAYCSALRDNPALAESEREARVAAYAREMRRALAAPPPPKPPDDPRDRARAELARLPVPYTPQAFFAAIREGNARVVRLFLAAGIDPLQEDRDRETPLSTAVHRGQTEIVRILLDAGVKPDGWSLTRAVYGDDLDLVRLLLARKPTREAIAQVFSNAVRVGHLPAAQLLVDHGAEVKALDASTLSQAGSMVGDDPARAEIFAWLHARGVAIDQPDRHGFTPLMQAAMHGNASALRVLMRLGADVNRYCACPGVDDGGMTPVLLAALKGEDEPIRLLLDAGADPAARTAKGRTALHILAGRGVSAVPTMERLLGKGAPPDAADAKGVTPLMLVPAVFARTLLARGARVDARDHDGLTPLVYAAYQGDVEAIVLLLDHGAAIDARTRAGRSALAVAVRRGEVRAVRALLQRGAKTDLADENGLVALDHARALREGEDKQAIVRLLNNAGVR